MLLGDVVEMGAHKYGDRPAVVFNDDEISFAELAGRARRLANALLDRAEPGDRVAILSQNRPEYVDAYFGVPMAGMALNFLNYRLAPREWARIVADAEASVFLVEDEYLAAVEGIRDQMPSVKTVVAIGDGRADAHYDDLLAAASADAPPVVGNESEMAWLIYTSGTTGMPKGAMLSHRNIITSSMS